MKKPKVTVRSVVHMSDEEKLALLLGGETGVSESLTTQAMIPQADLLALAKALEDAIVERETYVHGEGWDVADMDVQRACDALTTALAAQQANFTAAEMTIASFENRVSDLRDQVAAQQERIERLTKALELVMGRIEASLQDCRNGIQIAELTDDGPLKQRCIAQGLDLERLLDKLRHATPGTPAAGVWVPVEITLHAGNVLPDNRMVASFIWPEELGELRIPTKWLIAAKP
jgi:uncharacterized coiled-coil protein SlyX